MKNPLIGLFLLCLLAPAAGGQSMGLLMEEADLVVAARTLKTGENPRSRQFVLLDLEVIRGDLQEPDIHVVCFKDLCCQNHLHDGARSLLFLRRMEGLVDGLDSPGPVYRIFSGNLGMLGLETDQEASILDMARTCARAVESNGAERARAMVDVLGAALEEDVDCLMNSAAFDVIATPGALDLLDSYDLSLAEQRFLEAAPVSVLKESLLLLLGEASPPGLIPLLEDLTRSREGVYYLNQTAALLRAKGDAGTARRLVAGFGELEGVARVNVLYVLGRLGSGKGLTALESVMWDYLDIHHTAIIDALAADRTDAAVQALSNIVQGCRSSATLMALAALARINSSAARTQLEYIAQAEALDETIRNQAAALLAGLLR